MMKKSTLRTRLAIVAMAVAMIGSTSLFAQSISINFGANRSASAVDEAGKTTGAIPIAGNLWNNTTVNGGGTLFNLIDSTGTTTGASVTWTANNTWESASTGATATSENGDLTKGYLDDGGPGWSVTLNDSPFLVNNIYIISATDGDGTMAAVSVNGTYYKGDGAGGTILASGAADTWSASPWSDADTLIESDNYLKITNQTGVVLAADRNSARAAIAGLQVQEGYFDSNTASYWDTNGSSAGAGGTTPNGNWADANWSSSADGTVGTTNWTPGIAAVFSAGNDATGAYTVTLAGTQDADAVLVEDGDVTLTGGTLNLTGTAALRGGGAGLTVDSLITAANLRTIGAVTLNNASNSIAGTINISGTTTLGVPYTWNKTAGGGTVDMGANNLTVGDATDSSLGALLGTAVLTKTGTGTLAIGSATGFGGTATISDGTLAFGGGDLDWNVSGTGNFAKVGGGTLNLLTKILSTGSLIVDGGTIPLSDTDLISNPTSVALTGNGILSYQVTGVTTLPSAPVTFTASGQLRQNGLAGTDKLEITNKAIAGTTSDGNGNAVDGIISSYGGEIVFGTGAVATFRELKLNSGNVTIEAGADLTARYLNIGEWNGTADVVTQTGGTVTMEAGSNGIRIAHWGGADRKYIISGGTLDATALAGNGGAARFINIGWDGDGSMEVGGGAGIATVKAAGILFDVHSGNESGNSFLTLLPNGVVEVGSLGTNGNDFLDGFNLAGGLLRGKAIATWNADMFAWNGTTTAIDIDADVIVDLTGTLSGSGDLDKIGAGRIVLSNIGTYTGTIAVDDGTLGVNGTLEIGVTVNSGGAIQGGGVTTTGTGTVDKLTLNAGSTASFRVDPVGNTADQINIAALNGFTTAATTTANIIPSSPVSVGDEFTLFDYAGTIQGGGFGAITASVGGNPHYSVSLSNDTTSTVIKATVDAVDADIIWTGAGGATWDVGTTTSWKMESDSTASNYYSHDYVKFDDNSPTGTIALVGMIRPASVEFNSTNDHTLTGSGIGGAIGLTKAGTGTLTLLNDNTYLGDTDIQAGTVNVGDGGTTGAIGGGNIVVAAGAAVEYNRSDTVSIAGQTITGGGLLVQNGSGNLRLDNSALGEDAFAFDLDVNSGTVTLDGGFFVGETEGQSLGTVNVEDGGTLVINTGRWGAKSAVGSVMNINTGGIVYWDQPHPWGYWGTGGVGAVLNINGGTMDLRNSGGEGPRLFMTGGSLISSGDGNPEVFRSNSTITINESPDTATISTGLRIDGNRTFQVANGTNDVDLLVSGVISQLAGGDRILTKAGDGLMVVTAANTYTGGTTIDGGTLLVNNTSGSGTGPGLVLVNSGGTLGGIGSISGAVTISGGTAAPGASVGILAVDSVIFEIGGTPGDYDDNGMVEQGDLDLVLLNWGSESLPAGWVNEPPTFPIGTEELDVVRANWGGSGSATPSFDVELSGSGGVAGTDFDQLAVANLATLGGDLSIELIDSFTPGNTDEFTILTAATLSGAFENVADGGRLDAIGGGSFLVDYDGTTNTVVLSDYLAPAASAAVPEPASLLLIMMGLVGFGLLRKRSK